MLILRCGCPGRSRDEKCRYHDAHDGDQHYVQPSHVAPFPITHHTLSVLSAVACAANAKSGPSATTSACAIAGDSRLRYWLLTSPKRPSSIIGFAPPPCATGLPFSRRRMRTPCYGCIVHRSYTGSQSCAIPLGANPLRCDVAPCPAAPF